MPRSSWSAAVERTARSLPARCAPCWLVAKRQRGAPAARKSVRGRRWQRWRHFASGVVARKAALMLGLRPQILRLAPAGRGASL